VWITSSVKAAKAPTNIALGNFDGVHLGHQRVMAEVLTGDAAPVQQSVQQPAHRLAQAQADQAQADQAQADQAQADQAQADQAQADQAQTQITAQSVAALHSCVMALSNDLFNAEQTSAGQGDLQTIEQTPKRPPERPPNRQIEPTDLAINNFDGASSALYDALSPHDAPAIYPTVVTFSPHPQAYFSGVSRALLTPIAEKTWQMAQMGIRQLVMLPFDEAIAQLTPEAFVEEILVKGLQAKRISVGSDFRFGKGRSGNAEGLQAIAAKHGVPVVLVPLRHEQGDRISSSRIREALQTGEVEVATHLLGRPYTLTGRVVQGQQLGRTIGFATANLQVSAEKYLPRTGVYSVRVYGAAPEPLCGVMNIGNRPTVQGQDLSVEVHILNWSGNLYGQLLTVSLEGFVRAEQKFDSLNGLKAQIAEDCEVAIATLNLP
jgi:riboflavin kinase / FMN adenylyltransferase